jgi:sec-independent protein translocase protein TatC
MQGNSKSTQAGEMRSSGTAENLTEGAPLLAHLGELRRRFVVSLIAAAACAVAAFVFYAPIVGYLIRPFALIRPPGAESVLYATTIFEGFLVKLRVSLITGLIASSPVHLFNLVGFIFPALTAREKKIVLGALVASLLLVLAGFAFGYYQLVPLMIKVLTGAGFLPGQVGSLLGFQRNLFLLLNFLLAVLVVFQLPLVLEVLLVLGVVRRRTVLHASRYVVVCIFILAAIVTPSPDWVSQLAVAAPLTALFFLALLVARLFHFGDG